MIMENNTIEVIVNNTTTSARVHHARGRPGDNDIQRTITVGPYIKGTQ